MSSCTVLTEIETLRKLSSRHTTKTSSQMSQRRHRSNQKSATAERKQSAHSMENTSKKIWFIRQQLQLTQHWTESYVGLATNFIRNGTGATSPLSVTQTKDTKPNFQNTFGLSKTQRNPSKLNGKFWKIKSTSRSKHNLNQSSPQHFKNAKKRSSFC